MNNHGGVYITISHLDDFLGSEYVRPSMRMKLIKDHDNPYDDEAICVYTERGGKCGFVANSVHSVCRGTYSAGHVYESFGEEAYCVIRFAGDNTAIAEMEFPE